jgi:hypothetical protein
MKLLKYSNFTNEFRLNENLDQAKKLLRDTYKMNKAVLSVDPKLELDPSGLFIFNTEGDPFNFNELPEETKNAAKQKVREIKVTPEENSKVERGQIIKAVRDIIGDKLGYAYLFTYLLLVERIPIDDLKDMLAKLIEYRDLLTVKNPVDDKSLLRRPISNYIDTNVPNNGEQLVDDLENINLYKSTRKVYNELTPVLKKDYDEQPPVIKKQVDDLALAFAKLGMKDGKVDKNTQERLWKLFFGEIKVLPEDTEIRGKMYKKGDKIYSGQMVRFKNIREFIKAAQNYIKNIDNTETVKFYEAIEKCNDKYGNYGAQVCFDEGNILILEVKSFQANQMLNSHTRHCIKDSLSQWDYYVGGEGVYNKQYYIYNFNLPSYDTKSVIGITIEPKQKIRACHLKDDAGYSSQFQSLLKQWEKEYGVSDLWSYFKPLSDKEVDEKRRRVVANREIVKKGLTLEQVKKFLVEDGADVNAGKGQALDNAVAEGDVEKVKYLLDFGASPNLRTKQEATINKIADIAGKGEDIDVEASKKAFTILKYMLGAGAELTALVFKGMLGDYEAVKFCLDNGLNPNFEDSLPVRLCVKKGLLNILKLLLERGATLGTRGLNIAWAYESRNKDVVKILIDSGHSEGFDRSMAWIGHSPKLNAKEIVEILKEMQKMIDDGLVKPSPDKYRISEPGDNRRNCSYEDVVKKYGNLYNWVIAGNLDRLKSELSKMKMSDSEIKEFLKY